MGKKMGDKMNPEDEVPSVGLGRALAVILVLHIIAIAAIWIGVKYGAGKEDGKSDAKSEGADALQMFLRELRNNPEMAKDPELIRSIADRMNLKEDSIVSYKGKDMKFGDLLTDILLDMSSPDPAEARDVDADKGESRGKSNGLPMEQ